jgi:hypothetical protein
MLGMPFAFLTRNSPCRGSHVPRRYSHFVYGFIQSGLTRGIAAAIASVPLAASGNFLMHWLQAWLFSWLLMLPVVLFAAPAIRRLAYAVTTEE